MTIILHPPEDVSFSGDLISAEDQERIGRALRAAVQRAVDNAARRSAPRSPGAERSNQDPQETFDPARADLAQGIYRVPSYQDKGQLSGIKLLEWLPKTAPGYDIKDGPSPLQGALIMTLPGLHYILLGSPRYVTAGTLTQAYLLGQVVFGAASFVIAHGPTGSRDMRYWAVGTNPVVSDEDLGKEVPIKLGPGEEALPADLVGATLEVGEELAVQLGREGLYLTRGFVTKESVHWHGRKMAELWYAQLEAERREGVTVPPTEIRRLVFAEIDLLVAQFEAGDETNLQRAAELLSLLDWHAFSLVDWQTKAGYLKVLLAAETWQVEEVAVVQIFQSLRSDSEVNAVIALLKEAGRYDQLFDDLDDELYDLLVTVGERFPKDHGPLTLDGLVRLLQSLGLVPGSLKDTLISGVFAGPVANVLKTISDGGSVTDAMYDEAHDAVMGFWHFSGDLWQSAESVITDPGKVIGGAKGLAQMLFEVQMASMGYPPAIEKITNILRGLGEKGLAGMRGADRLGCGEKVVRRIKWRLVWEIASLFVGVGEIKALIELPVIAEKLAAVARFLAVLIRLGETADLDLEGTRLARLASMLKAERAAFASVEEAADLLSRLPEKDIRRLAKLIREVDIREGETLAQLWSRSSDLQAAVEDAIAKTDLLRTMAGKAGGLTEEMVEAFHALIGDDGLPLADAQKVVSAIPEGEGARFAATLKRIPEGSSAAFLELVAASTSRMEAVAKLGYDTFASIYRRAASRGEMVDQYLATLNDIEARAGSPEEFRKLLDRLEHDDPASWLDVENTGRIRAISDWAQQLSGSPGGPAWPRPAAAPWPGRNGGQPDRSSGRGHRTDLGRRGRHGSRGDCRHRRSGARWPAPAEAVRRPWRRLRQLSGMGRNPFHRS